MADPMGHSTGPLHFPGSLRTDENVETTCRYTFSCDFCHAENFQAHASAQIQSQRVQDEIFPFPAGLLRPDIQAMMGFKCDLKIYGFSIRPPTIF